MTIHSTSYIKQLLADIDTLQSLIDKGEISETVYRIGSEQELCLIDRLANAAPYNIDILKSIDSPYYTTELAKFNLEINIEPSELKGNALSELEEDLLEKIQLVRSKGEQYNARVYLGGILPTLRFMDMDLENITPTKRYFELVKNITQKRGDYELRIQGEDELLMRHDSVFLEAATTSFQIHLQVPPSQFSKFYNIAQLIAAPCLAVSANSNYLFRKKLWHETRIALLRQSIDVIKTPSNLREATSRVSFGSKWNTGGIVELFKEDISHHRTLLLPEERIFDEASTFSLPALQSYNSTIYRWNRPVYGILDGIPHFRIENRIFPSGPTVKDQIANAAFWYGCMFGIYSEGISFEEKLDFDSVKNNFIQAARTSLNSNVDWYDGKSYPISDLIIRQLIPLAYQGLNHIGLDKADIQLYLDIILRRTEKKMSPAIWSYKSLKKLKNQNIDPQNLPSSLVEYSVAMQIQNKPLHEWEILDKNMSTKKLPADITIEEAMDKDIFTIRSEDMIQLATDMIDWQKIRYIMVEDEQGNLNGIVSSRNLLKHINRHLYHNEKAPLTIADVMVSNPITIDSNAKLSSALAMMHKYQIGCLPVIQKGKLVGIVTEKTFLSIMQNMIKE